MQKGNFMHGLVALHSWSSLRSNSASHCILHRSNSPVHQLKMEAFLNSSRVGGKVRFPCFTAELNETSHFSTSRSSPWCVIVCPLFLPHSLFLKHAPHSPEQFSICLQVTYPLRGSEASLFPFPTTDHSQTCSLPGQINGGEREIIRFSPFCCTNIGWVLSICHTLYLLYISEQLPSSSCSQRKQRLRGVKPFSEDHTAGNW